MRTTLAVLLLLVAASESFAQCGPYGCQSPSCGPQYTIRRPIMSPNVQQSIQQQVTITPQAGLVQVVSSIRDGDTTRRKHGSGTVIFAQNNPRRAYVLTCAHIFGADWEIEVQAVEGWRGTATILATEATMDVALLVVEDVPASVQYLRLDLQQTNAGTVVAYHGWSGGRYNRFGGRILRGLGRLLVGTGRVLEGMSGGPWLSDKGVVAVITDMNVTDQEVGGPGAVAIHQWIVASGYGVIVGQQATTPEQPTPPLPEPEEKPDPEQVVVDLKLIAVVEANTKAIANHETRILALEAVAPIKGDKGDKGDPGEKGDPGTSGQPAKVALLDGQGNVYRIIEPDGEGVIAIPAVRLQTFDGDGKFHSETTAPLGEPLGLSAEFVSRKGT